MTRVCHNCPSRTPAVSRELAKEIVKRVTREQTLPVLERCVAWLTTNHPGLDVYTKLLGKQYAPQEQEAIAADLYAVERIPCPFASSDGCLLDGCATLPEWQRESLHISWVWLPTAIVKLCLPDMLNDLIRGGKVADAKVAVLRMREGFPPPRVSTNEPFVAQMHD